MQKDGEGSRRNTNQKRRKATSGQRKRGTRTLHSKKKREVEALLSPAVR